MSAELHFCVRFYVRTGWLVMLMSESDSLICKFRALCIILNPYPLCTPHPTPTQQGACRYSGAKITTVMHDLRDASFSLFLMSLTLLLIQEHCTSCTIIMSGVQLQSPASAAESGITNVFTSSHNCSSEIRSTQLIQTLCRCGLEKACNLASCFLYSLE